MELTGNSDLSPPADQELEFSLFGPRYGESALLHYGFGRWLVIDSCLAKSGRPAALEYLRTLGVNPGRSVRFVLASHFDDDHIRGLSEILRESENARFSVSSAMSREEFQAFLKPSMALSASFPGGASELGKCLQIVKSRAGKGLTAASANKVIFRDARNSIQLVEVIALTPSDELVARTINNLVGLRPDGPRVRMTFKNNDVSVVTQINVGPVQILHGADLERRADGSIGWLGILDDPDRSPINASLYKISHHGSENGDHDRIWAELVGADSPAALAPFSKGSGLPSQADKERMLARGNSIYSSTKVVRKRKKFADNTIRRALKDGNIKAWESNGLPGQIRFRRPVAVDGAFDIALFGDACELRNVVTP